MIKLLILTPYIPYPINSGGNQGFFQLVDRLRAYVDVSIIIPCVESDSDAMKAIRKLWANVNFYFYHLDARGESEAESTLSFKILSKIKASVDRKLQRRLKKADSGDLIWSNSILKFNSSELNEGYINFVYEVIHSNEFDLIQVDFFGLIDIVNILPEDIKKVFIHHEIRYVRAYQELNLLQNPKPVAYYLFNSLKKYEIGNLNAYDAIVAMTDVDKAKLSDVLRSDIKIATSPAIVEVKDFEISEAFQFKNKLIYLGGSEHTPNLDAVDWFLNNCWGEVRKVKPELELHIIGQWNSKLKTFYAEKFENILFRGFVEDLSEELSGAIMIVPLRIGSGVRIKILDAISKGVPIISTSIGAEGIMLNDKEDCFIADNNEAFIEAVLTLTGDNNLCNDFRLNARKKMELRETPDELALRRLHIYEEILGLPYTQKISDKNVITKG
ncbi:glycosyltransferase [uncultured Dysgonomonas sp.]|uniref:Putative Glycosyl transferase family protein n=1 Tax=uncultured Dysgonomonas sp. TaxID=206096 RepID=A0A212K2H6_9BACT|nr:glycosyltransferase [uncultured Dysgonomonas sp.]SBW05899.1 putative Glycosyl transferase family protein [uncultured Dysgonomonas sp.]